MPDSLVNRPWLGELSLQLGWGGYLNELEESRDAFLSLVLLFIEDFGGGILSLRFWNSSTQKPRFLIADSPHAEVDLLLNKLAGLQDKFNFGPR